MSLHMFCLFWPENCAPNIFKDNELDKKVVVRKFRTTTPHGTIFICHFSHAPMQLVVPSVVRIAVMMLARICKSVFTPSLFIVV